MSILVGARGLWVISSTVSLSGDTGGVNCRVGTFRLTSAGARETGRQPTYPDVVEQLLHFLAVGRNLGLRSAEHILERTVRGDQHAPRETTSQSSTYSAYHKNPVGV